MQPNVYIFMGRYGAGKGTQTELLLKALREKDPAHPIFDMGMGVEFRKMIESKSYTAAKTKQIVDTGGLTPTFMPVYLWSKQFIERYVGNEHMVFDGTPRKVLEAQVLDTAFSFYGMPKPWVIYIDVEHDESMRRLALRHKEHGRKDDHPDAIVRRKQAYEDDIVPTAQWYKNNPNYAFLNINGVGTIDEVHQRILKAVGLQK